MPIREIATGRARSLWLLPVFALGLLTLIGSESVDDDDDNAPVEPVIVDFVIRSLTGSFDRDRGDNRTEITDVRLSGDYSANPGDTLSLDRSFVNIDTQTTFTVEISEPVDSDDVLIGTVTLVVNEPIDFGIGRDATTGRFTTTFSNSDVSETSTIVRMGDDVSGVGVTVGGAGSEQTLSWGDFRDAENDENDALDIRMASYAWGVLTTLYEVALITERDHRDIQDNRGDLEAMGTGTSKMIDCSVPSSGGAAGQRFPVWRSDAADTGSAGNGDTFETTFDNCQFTGGDFLDGRITLSDYLFDDQQPKSLGADVTLAELLIGGQEIDPNPQPANDLPRLAGEISLLYQQQAALTNR